MSEQQEKTHPIAGYIFAVVLACILVYLMGAFNGMDKAILVAPFFIGWALISVAMFGKLQGGDSHH